MDQSNPLKSIKVKNKNFELNEKLKKVKMPYNYESRAIASSGPCRVPESPKVWIMSHTQELLRTIFVSIRTMFSENDQAYIGYKEYFQELDSEAKESGYPNKLIETIVKASKLKYLNVFEHVTFTFGIRCLSRGTLLQLERHRVGWSLSVQSQRYVIEEEDFEHVIPKPIQNTNCEATYKKGIQNSKKCYEELISCGVEPENARYVLPNAITSNITATVNLRAFMDFYQSETKYSQGEIVELAENMKAELLMLEPMLEYLFEEE